MGVNGVVWLVAVLREHLTTVYLSGSVCLLNVVIVLVNL